MGELLQQGAYGSALLEINAAELDPTTVEAVGCELARALGSETGYAFWSPWASANSEFGPEHVYARWSDMVEHAEQVEPVVECLARERGWLPLAEQDRSGIAETMRREAEAGVYASASRPTPPEYEGPPLDYYDGGRRDQRLLPPWESVEVMEPPSRSPSLIDGLLRRGHVGIVVARAKSGKSWAAIALACAVATGGEWMGFRCSQGRVAFVDPELARNSLPNRFREVADAMGADLATVERNVRRWSLRGVLTTEGKPPTVADLAHDLALSGERFDLVILDSVSVFLSGADENASSDVRRLFGEVGRICEVTGASVLCVHHEGKALSGDREASARGRGSSVWTDAPDLCLSLVETFPPAGEPSDYLPRGERAFALECAAIREYGGFDPVRLVWSWPVFRVDRDGLTDGWKARSSKSAGGRATAESNKNRSKQRAASAILALCSEYLLEGFPVDGLSASEAAAMVSARLGEHVSTQVLKRYIETCDMFDVEQVSKQRWRVVAADLAN